MVTNQDFVRHWMSSTNISEVAEKTGLDRLAVSGKATSLRKKGVLLPKFNRGPVANAVNPAELNAIVAAALTQQNQ